MTVYVGSSIVNNMYLGSTAYSNIYVGSSNANAPLTALRATNAGFGAIGEIGPSTGIGQTTRMVTPTFLEAFSQFRLVYALFRIRTTSITATVDNGSGAAGNTLTITAVATGGIYVGMLIYNAGLAANVRVLAQVSGTLGGTGVYTLSGTAVLIASGTFTSDFADELFQGAGSNITYDAGFSNTVTAGYTGLPARTQVTFDTGSTTKVYNYTTWDKTIGYFKSDLMTRPGGASKAPMEIWTRATLPSNLAGIPINKVAQNVFVDRGWGNNLVTTGTAPDPVTATSITAATSTQGGSTYCITPIAIEMLTAGNSSTVIAFGDSRHAATGLGVNEPAGYGDQMGDVQGLTNATERGLYAVAKQHSVMLTKPTDRGTWLARSSASWGLRRGLAAVLGDPSARIVINAYGQNDQNTAAAPTGNPILTWATNMDAPLGWAINASNRVYIVTSTGTGSASAPTGTDTTADITFGTAIIRYIGTSTDASQRQGLAIAGKMLIINRRIRVDMSGASIIQEGMGPFSSSSDFWATAANQSDGFQMACGAYYQSQLNSLGSVFTGADRIVTMMLSLAGSRTVNGGADDGTRSWKTTPAGDISYLMTPDGIHHGNYGAEIGKAAWTKLAVTGSA